MNLPSLLRFLAPLSLLALLPIHAAIPSPRPDAARPSAPVEIERGPHHKVWQRITPRVLPDGRRFEERTGYIELETGKHYLQDGKWLESQEKIEVAKGGAAAWQGRHKAYFPANLKGGEVVLDIEGRRFRSQFLGLAYTETTSGKSVWLGQVKDSAGLLTAPNELTFRNACASINCDVKYTYKKASLAQDIILRENPPPPQEFGLDPDFTRLEAYTEFLEAPEPARTVLMIRAETDPAKRAAMHYPDFTDERLDYGVISIGSGRAFTIPPKEGEEQEDSYPVGKTWEHMDGRTILIEAIEYQQVEKQLKALPQAAVRANKTNLMLARHFPPRPVASPGKATAVNTLAINKLGPPKPGFVIDFIYLESATNFTFESYNTYYINGVVNLSGTTTIKGGTVLKFTNVVAQPKLFILGPIDCQTAPFFPAVLTAKDDDTVGEVIDGSTSTPRAFTNRTLTSNFYARRGLDLAGGTNYVLHDLHFKYAQEAIYANQTGVTLDLSDSQFNICLRAVGYAKASLRNILVAHANSEAFYSGSNRCEHVTFYDLNRLTNYGFLSLTNCLVVCATNNVSFLGTSNAVCDTDTGIFQSAGFGSNYLAADSPYRNAGTTNLSAIMRAKLAQRTTYPPVVLGTNIQTNLVLTAQAGLDTDTPDLGYHYDKLDYLASGVRLGSNVTVRVTNQVNIGVDYAVREWGFLFDQAKLICEGSPTQYNRIVHAGTVQEYASGNPESRAVFYDGESLSGLSEARFRFTEFTALANDGYLAYVGNNFLAWEMSHGWLRNQWLVLALAQGGGQTIGLTNNIFEPGSTAIYGPSASGLELRNNLFRQNTLTLAYGGTNWAARENLFDTAYVTDGGAAVANSHNAYWNCPTNLNNGTSNYFLTNLTYELGPLSCYYQPTNSPLTNVGSQLASLSGLYHFTTATNQVKETNSVVDIGPHFVALTANGNMMDTDGDGIPDYLNDNPRANPDDLIVLKNSTSNMLDVLANDLAIFDPSSGLTISQAENAAHGSVSIQGGLTLLYIPTPDFYGTDTFTYTIEDVRGSNAVGTVTVLVNHPPTATPDTAVVPEDSTNNLIDVLINDTTAPDTNETLTIIGVTTATNGTVAILYAGAQIAYTTTNANYFGADFFTYMISDSHGGTATSSVTITITNVNDPPLAWPINIMALEDSLCSSNLADNVLDPDGDTLQFSIVTGKGATNGLLSLSPSGPFDYSPFPNFFGQDGFYYWIRDGHGGLALGEVNINVSGVNDPPEAALTAPGEGDYFVANPTTNITLTALATDIDSVSLSVEFYANGVPLGTNTTPYTTNFFLPWSGVAADRYTLIAVACDESLRATSAPVHITVSAVAAPEDPDPGDYYNKELLLLQIVDGNFQYGLTNAILPKPLTVQVVNHDGMPKTNVPVIFTIMAGGGKLVESGSGIVTNMLILTTGTNGTTSALLRSPNNTNTLTLITASISGQTSQSEVTFVERAVSKCDIISISAGGWHNLALKADGTVIAWGGNDFGQTTVPAGLTNVIAVSAGGWHSLALKNDGTLRAWGQYYENVQAFVPTNLANAIAIASGNGFDLALISGGTVTAWGDFIFGPMNQPPSGLSDVISIAARGAHSLALKSDGTVVAWGAQTNVPSSLSNVIAIAAGNYHSVALKADHTVVAWGANDYGQTNVPAGLTNVIAIAAGGFHSLALKSDGSIVAWGYNAYGQLNVPSNVGRAVALSAGDYHSVALRSDGSVVGWGSNSDGQANSIPEGGDAPVMFLLFTPLE